MVKVCMMTSVHRVGDTRIFVKEASTLAKAGPHEVVVVVPHSQDGKDGNVRIRAVPRPGSRWRRMTVTTWQVFRAGWDERCDVYHIHDPELIPVGVALKALGRTVVYDVHEHVPRQIMSKHWIPKGLRRAAAWLAGVIERLAGLCFDAIIVAWPAIAGRFPGGKTVLLRNYPIMDELSGGSGAVPYADRPPWVVYVGAISEIRCASVMVSAIGLLRQLPRVRLRLAGVMTPPDLEKGLRTLRGWELVDWLGWQSREDVRKVLGSARVGLLLFRPEPNHVEALPNKLFEYMSAAIPVVASDFPLWREIIGREACGLLVNPADPEQVSDAVLQLLSDVEKAGEMGKRGQMAVQKKYNWERESEKLLHLYAKLTGGSTQPGAL